MRPLASRQRGATLIIAMVMLMVITMFVISAIKLSSVNLQIVGNFQWQKQMELLTDSALEAVISGVANFTTPTATDICQDGTVVVAGGCSLLNPKIGTVTAPQCTSTRVASGYTKKLGEMAPEDNDWVLTAAVVDSVSQAKVTIQRGVTVRMLAGNCPP